VTLRTRPMPDRSGRGRMLLRRFGCVASGAFLLLTQSGMQAQIMKAYSLFGRLDGGVSGRGEGKREADIRKQECS